MSARPSDLLRLRAIIEQVEALLEVVNTFGVDGDAQVFSSSPVLRTCRAAIDQHMTQICEEAREVTDETRGQMGHIPWNSVAEMRSYLVHAYGSLKADQVWDTIVGGELAELRDACASCVDEIERGDYVPGHWSRTAERMAKTNGR